MIFSSLTFIVLFLPIFLLVYFCVPKKCIKARNLVLLAFSLLFYAAGEPVWVVLLIFSASCDCLIGLFMEKYQGKWQSKVLLVISMCCSLGLLVVFKYSEFLLGLVGIHIAFAPALPIGISFYTFQTMSYSIDVYRGRIKAQRSPLAFLTYVAMFPPLVAGPIIRYADVEKMLKDRNTSLEMISAGISRFIMGLGKKIIFANHAGVVANELLGQGDASTLAVWLGILMFMFQIYFDFSGYSDMAIGLGKIIGFDFKENFDYPYVSKSITEFWRRWHMTLGNWFRDYVYIPLGGNRVSQARWIFNIAAVWMLTGFWHGADWNFIVWGLMMAILLVSEKFFLSKLLSKVRPLAHVYVMFFVIISFVVFNGEGMVGAWSDLRGMFGVGGVPLTGEQSIYYLRSFGPMFIVAALLSTPLLKKLGDGLLEKRSKWTLFEPVLVAASLVIVTANLVDGSFNPFIYFRF